MGGKSFVAGAPQAFADPSAYVTLSLLTRRCSYPRYALTAPPDVSLLGKQQLRRPRGVKSSR
jgi:hypothetical protein